MINLSLYEIQNLKRICNARNTGHFASCYKYGNDVIKLFKCLNPLTEDKNSIFYEKCLSFESRLKQLSKLKINHVSFPLELIYINDNFIGYTMPFYNGSTLLTYVLKRISKGFSFSEEEIYDMYFNLYEKIVLLSDEKIVIRDIKADNIIKLDNDLCIIDVDFFEIVDTLSKEEILKKNIKELNFGLLKLFNIVSEGEKITYSDEDIESKDFIKLIYNKK